MISSDTALRLIDLIYEAAETPEIWPAFCQKLNAELDATASFFMRVNPSTADGILCETTDDIDKRFLAQYNSYFELIDPALRHHAAALLNAGVTLTQQMCPDNVLERMDYHNEFLRRLNIFHGIGATLLQEASVYSALSIMRPRRKGPFDKEAVDSLTVLLPHLQRAARLQTQTSLLTGIRKSLDSIPDSVILLDSQARIVMMSAAAERILRQDDGIGIARNGILRQTSPRIDTLSQMVLRTAQTAQGKGFYAGGCLTIERPSGKRPYAVFVSPIHFSHRGPIVAQPVTLVSISDPEGTPFVSSEALARVFGFTPAEAKLAAILATGSELSKACEILSVRKNTGRAHLRSIFAKTGVRRQSELVFQLSRIRSGYLRDADLSGNPTSDE